MTTCKYCKSSSVQQKDYTATFSYKGHKLEYLGKYLLCSACEREYIPRELILLNEADAREARKQADGLLTSVQILEARKKLKLTQDQASQVFGGGKNAFSKYERNEVTQSVAMDKLIQICLEYTAVFEKLCNDAGINKVEDDFKIIFDEKFKNIEPIESTDTPIKIKMDPEKHLNFLDSNYG